MLLADTVTSKQQEVECRTSTSKALVKIQLSSKQGLLTTGEAKGRVWLIFELSLIDSLGKVKVAIQASAV